MKFLRALLSDSFNILTQNLTLMWPIFALVGISILIDQGGSPEAALALDPITIARIAIWFAIEMAFIAGMCHMAYQAVQRVLHPNKEKPASPLDSLTLLQEFFPGVSAFFPSFFFGGLIQIAFLAGIFFSAQYILEHYWGGFPNSLNTLFKLAAEQQPITVAEKYVHSLSIHDLTQIVKVGLLSFVGIGIFGIFYLFTMYWPAYVIREDISAPAAYLKSIRQVIRDPLYALVIFFSCLIVQVVLTVLLSSNNVLLSMLLFLFILMSYIWQILMINYYVISKTPKEHPNENEHKLSLKA